MLTFVASVNNRTDTRQSVITSYIDLNVDNENSNWKAQKDSHFVQTKCINLNWYISKKKTGWVFLKVV